MHLQDQMHELLKSKKNFKLILLTDLENLDGKWISSLYDKEYNLFSSITIEDIL